MSGTYAWDAGRLYPYEEYGSWAGGTFATHSRGVGTGFIGSVFTGIYPFSSVAFPLNYSPEFPSRGSTGTGGPTDVRTYPLSAVSYPLNYSPEFPSTGIAPASRSYDSRTYPRTSYEGGLLYMPGTEYFGISNPGQEQAIAFNGRLIAIGSGPWQIIQDTQGEQAVQMSAAQLPISAPPFTLGQGKTIDMPAASLTLTAGAFTLPPYSLTPTPSGLLLLRCG